MNSNKNINDNLYNTNNSAKLEKKFWLKLVRFFKQIWLFIKNIANKIWSKIKNPYGFFLALFYVMSISIIFLTILFVCFGIESFVVYIFYGLSFVSLCYFIYSIIFIAPKIKSNVINFANKYKFTSELISNYGFRTFIFTVISFIVNIGFSIFQGVIGILSRSYLQITLAVYYIIFSVMRGSLLYSKLKSKNKTKEKVLKDDLLNYKKTGILLIILTIVLSGFVVLTYFNNPIKKYTGVIIYVVALYTFYKLTLAIYNIFKAKKSKDISLVNIRNIGFADSLVSLFSLQIALLLEFGSGDSKFYNALTGSCVCFVVIILGIIMIINSNKKLNKVDINIGK